jgi:hypothetical protein
MDGAVGLWHRDTGEPFAILTTPSQGRTSIVPTDQLVSYRRHPAAGIARLLAQLSQQRRKFVDGQTKLRQQLTALLKLYFPVVLELFGKGHQLNLLLSVRHDYRRFRSLRRRARRSLVLAARWACSAWR